jgi:NAD(P) transhydrogenase
VFAAFGRVANLDGIGLDRLQLAITSARHVQVNERFETSIPGISRPAMPSGRRRWPARPRIRAGARRWRLGAAAARRHQPGAERRVHHSGNRLRGAIAERGRGEENRCGVGRADFSEVARAHIAGEPAGFLALLCERSTARVLGVQVIGEGATELVHLGQAAIATGATADFFIEQIFNFPTMTEAYRIAAFDMLKQRAEALAPSGGKSGGLTKPRARRRTTSCESNIAELAALDLGGALHEAREVVGHGLLAMVLSMALMMASAASSQPM